MPIDTTALSLGNPIASKASLPSRADAEQVSQNGNSPGAADPGHGGSASSASGHGADAGPTAQTRSASSGQQAPGPSAQTRRTQALQSSSSARASAATPSKPQAGTDGQASAEEAGADFGSVMASTRDSSAGSGTATAAATRTPTPTTSGATATDQTAPTPTDAMSWIAQIMSPAAARAAAATSAAADTAETGPSPSPVGSATGAPPSAGATARPTRPGLPGTNDTTAGDAATALPAAGTSDDEDAAVQTSDAQSGASTATPVAGNPNALAEVQKVISGLTGASGASGAGGGAGAHAATTGSVGDAAQAAAALQASALSPTAVGAGSSTLTLQSSVTSAGFPEEVSSAVTGLAQAGITQAQLQMNPADLGPVQVHITMQAGQASVWFGATHSDTRAALEQSLPQLREMFAGAGMNLTDSGVFREPPQQQQAQSSTPGGSSGESNLEPAAATVTQVANVRLSLLDTYA